jgi:hypothetical protein
MLPGIPKGNCIGFSGPHQQVSSAASFATPVSCKRIFHTGMCEKAGSAVMWKLFLDTPPT